MPTICVWRCRMKTITGIITVVVVPQVVAHHPEEEEVPMVVVANRLVNLTPVDRVVVARVVAAVSRANSVRARIQKTAKIPQGKEQKSACAGAGSHWCPWGGKAASQPAPQRYCTITAAAAATSTTICQTPSAATKVSKGSATCKTARSRVGGRSSRRRKRTSPESG
uniref:Putative secreted protein n=1 Tax=Anopheles darlingi TaxID=43151 RepID=A0A2M4D9N7_ANODA